MKIIVNIFFCLLLFSCNNTENKNQIEAASSNEGTPTTTTSIEKEAVLKKDNPKQQSNYGDLFERGNIDCDFITAASLAEAINVPASLVEEGYTSCIYNLTEPKGTKTNFKFSIQEWGNKTVLKEIQTAKENAETFGKDSKLSQYRLSETGDTYLSMHQNRMVRILNEKSTKVIIISYSIETSPNKTGIEKVSEEKDIARERSYSIANYILNTHKQ
ncbi:hypothetical protein [Rasiella sp. SM2506]|uniref:hypothetical protein n=1 Tax=Rasiella sp. SM2506 TaxID=3423914 RepID=UPI003D7984A2